MHNDKQKIRFSEIFYHIVKDKRLIIILTALGLVSGILISVLGYIRGEMTKQYKITASVAVSAQIESGRFSSRYDSPNREDFILSEDMAESAMYVMSSDSTTAAVVDNLNLVGVSAKSIRDNLTLTRYKETQIIEIALTWRSEKDGISILQALTEVSDDTMLNTLRIGRLYVVNPPSATYIFGGNIKITMLFYATLVGLLAGILISLSKMQLAPKLIRPEEMEKRFGVEVFGTLPLNQKYREASSISVLPDVISSEISSAANILLNRMERAEINRIYITSTDRKEGKTRITADLAYRIAQSGKKVLAVDCNFKNPTLASMFEINSTEYSLNDVYRGDCDISDAVIRVSGCLYLLPSALETSADFTSDAMMDLLDKVFEDYDYVLIDVDAVGNNSEVIRFNRVAQASLFVVKFDYAELADVQKAMTRVSKSGLPIAGCIVNASKTWRDALRNLDKIVKSTNKKSKKK